MKPLRDWLGPKLHSRSFPWVVLVIAGALALPVALLVILGTWLEYQESPPTCYGLGWGCTPGPGSTGVFAAVIWGMAWACVAVPMLVSELFWERVATIRSFVALAALVVGTGAALLLCGAVAVRALS